MKIVKKSICIILALFSILALNACGEKNEPETYPPAKVMTIKKINDDYDANFLRAKETHIGQRYRCNAQVTGIYEDYVSANVFSCRVNLYYNSDQKAFAMTILEGDVITFEGTVTDDRIENAEYEFNRDFDFKDVLFLDVLYNNAGNPYIEE